MQPDFEGLMSKKSDEDLLEYVNNVSRYTPEAISSAIKELKKRGRELSEIELVKVETGLKEKIEHEKKETQTMSSNSWSKNIVTDSNAPAFYSQRAIWVFSVIFTVIFGAVLLASNLKEKKFKWTVIGFGIAYTSIAILILNILPHNTGLT